MSDCTCACCGGPSERLRYFPRQLITAEDMCAEQDYFVDKMRKHNRFLHGWGVVCGFDVVAPGKQDPAWQVTICPGYLVTPQGDEVHLCDPVILDIEKGAATPEPCCEPWPCPPRGQMPGASGRARIVFIAVRYAECHSRPVRVHPAGCGCGCGDSACEYSRVRESFEIKVLWELPQSHIAAHEYDLKWRKLMGEWATSGGQLLIGASTAGELDEAPSAGPFNAAAMVAAGRRESAVIPRGLRYLPVPPCPECVDDPWVVIAAVQLPDEEGTPITNISYAPRRALWSVSRLMALMAG